MNWDYYLNKYSVYLALYDRFKWVIMPLIGFIIGWLLGEFL